MSAERTYARILKTTTLIGGSSVVNIAFGVVRTKAMALLLGPAGVGLIGLYTSVADLAERAAGLGLQSSGVRQIAEATGSGDAARIARTAAVLRRVSILAGLLGALLLVLLARPVAQLTFGTTEYAGAVALLALAVFFKAVSGAQAALIQGMRRIRDLARINVLGAGIGTAASIPIVYVFGQQGVVPSLVAVAAVTLIVSWWYTRRIDVEAASLSVRDTLRESSALLKLGFAFMASGFLSVAAPYVIRIIVHREAGVEAAGMYQAAWAIGGLYVGFILQAMGADFYPRLTAHSTDNAACNRLINEQALVSFLLAGPGVLATLTCAPLVVSIFYSAEFGEAVHVLRWVCLGMMLRVVSWPMGFMVVARGAHHTMIWTEVAATVVQIGLAWALVPRAGVTGAGAAFFGLYVWHGALIYAITRRMSGFRWSPENRRVGMVFLPLTAIVFAGFYVLPAPAAVATGLCATSASALYSVRYLLELVPPDALPAFVRRSSLVASARLIGTAAQSR